VIDRWVVQRAIERLKEWAACGELPEAVNAGTRGVLRPGPEARQARELLGSGLPLLAVNLSGTSLNEQSFIDFVLQQVGDATLAQALCFEITETAAVTNFDAAEQFVRKARERRCRVSLDDFGAGMSSFEYLRRFPVDAIKINGSFIEHIATNPFDREIVSAISGIARSMGAAVVAEKIEERTALDILLGMDVAYGQGYFLHRPEPLETIVARATGSVAQQRFG
jgi:EAL domain-containing protein (putative c-di-GMP-specific phosphodiesterase class I)